MTNSAIQFEQNDQGLDSVRLQWKGAEARVYLQGAHVAEYAPAGSENILWVSDGSFFQSGKAIRGGIPICWPWFGPSSQAGRPQHGFARQTLFELISSQSNEDHAQVVLCLDASKAPFDECKGKLQLEVEIRLSDSLWMEMRTTNLSNESIAISNCLHNYFSVQDVSKVELPQLFQTSYLDKVAGGERSLQAEPFSVTAELDRIYLDAPESVQLVDTLADRQIDVTRWGCEHLVVWNPWRERAQQMQDFDELGYINMICVEPANAAADSIELLPGSVQRSGQRIKLM